MPIAFAWLLPIAGLLFTMQLASTAEHGSTSLELPDFVTAGSRELTGRTSVELHMEFAEPERLTSRTAGLITSVHVATGDSLLQGNPVFGVDGADVYAFRGTQPLYRDLREGDKGDLVAALGDFLVSRGELSATDNVYGPVFRAAVIRFQEKAGLAERDGVFRPAYVVYIPDSAQHVGAVSLRVGDPVDVGDVLAEASATPSSGYFVAPDAPEALSTLATAPIELAAGDATFDLENGIVLSASETTAIYAFLLSQISEGTLSSNAITWDDSFASVGGIFLQFGEPQVFASVPSTALYTSPGGTVCVFVEPPDAPHDARPVGVTSSTEVGIALIDPDFIGLVISGNPSSLPRQELEECS
jgi:hypothetical protein